MASGSTIRNAFSSVLMRTLRLRHTAFVVWLASTVVSSACASLPVEPIPKIYEAQQAVDRYITSGRYDADFARVVEDASAYLEERARLVARPAIVLDIDETALTNWPAYKANGWVRIVNGECNLEQGPCGLRAWQATAQSTALKPTLQLDKRAKSLGVAVFFITGRPSNLRDATERNLREQGFEWDEVILAPPGAQFPSAADFKAPERRKIVERGYTILLTMGDQQSDLTGGYAERTFRLPNPVYFLP
jgi:predicted secreted acid phosphatase